MAHSIQAHSLPIVARQKLALPLYTKFLSVTLDHRFNNILLSTLEDDTKALENVEFVAVRVMEALEPANAKYVGHLKDNAGNLHVFALRDSERLPFQVPVAEVKK